jgi:hypothetical protein
MNFPSFLNQPYASGEGNALAHSETGVSLTNPPTPSRASPPHPTHERGDRGREDKRRQYNGREDKGREDMCGRREGKGTQGNGRQKTGIQLLPSEPASRGAKVVC